MEKISKRVSALEEVNNNVKLLTEMVMSHSQGGAAARSSEDLMKVRLSPPCPRPPQGPCGPDLPALLPPGTVPALRADAAHTLPTGQ